jgi:hypothetical protein
VRVRKTVGNVRLMSVNEASLGTKDSSRSKDGVRSQWMRGEKELMH